MLLAMLMGTAGAPVAQFLVSGDWHVDTASLKAAGTLYTTGIKATTGGTGTDCTVNILTVDVGDGHIDTFSIAAGGTGYKVGDVLAIAGGTDGTVTVTKIDSLNGMIDFKEITDELTGSVPSLLYTGATLATAIAAAMMAAPGRTFTYACTYNAATGEFTISAGSNFEILWLSGTHAAYDINGLCGYSATADASGEKTYESDTAANLVNKHTFSMANTTFGIFGTYATAKHTKIHIVPSFKVLKAVFSMSKGLVKSVFSLRGNKVIDTSSVISAMSAVTYPDIGNRVKFSQGVFRMNNQSGGALADGDIIGVKGFGPEPERKMDSEITNQAAYIIEPRENGKPTVKLTLDFARMDDVNAAYFASWIAETEKKADITFMGATINGVLYRYLKFEFPRLKIEDVDYPDGNIIPAKMVLRGLVAAEAPEGMSGITDPIHITLQNSQTADYLA
jgi:hypothetical protein